MSLIHWSTFWGSFQISPQTIELFKHGIDIYIIIDRVTTENANGFSEEDLALLTNLNNAQLLLYAHNNQKLELLDALSKIGNETQLSPEKLLPLALKLTKRFIEEAVLKNDINALNNIISKCAALNKISPGFDFAMKAGNCLEILAMHGHEELVTSFCDKNTGIQYFHDAVIKGNSLVVKTLLNTGMNELINTDFPTKGFLHYGISSEALKRINRYEERGNIAIYHAVESGNIEVVKMLLDVGVDIKKGVFHGDTSLSIAKDAELAKLLGKYAHNPVDYLLEAHQNNPLAFIKAIENVAKTDYDFHQYQSPDRTWDSDHEKITMFLNQEIVNEKTTNFGKIINSGNRKALELALLFQPDITESDQILIDRCYPAEQILPAAPANPKPKSTQSWVSYIGDMLGITDKSR